LAFGQAFAKHHRNIPLTAASSYKCLSKVLLIGERSLRLALSEYVAHYHAERNHQGKDNVLLFPRDTQTRRGGPVQCRERQGGLFCIIIIKKPRNLAEKSRMILWLEVDCTRARPTMLLANAQVSPAVVLIILPLAWRLSALSQTNAKFPSTNMDRQQRGPKGVLCHA
jgi:hypothetical protein